MNLPLLLIILGLMALTALGCVLIRHVNRCHMPRRRKRLDLKIAACAVMAFALFAAFCSPASAADAGTTAKFIDSITVAPVAALRSADITGPSTLGAGLDLGVAVNPFVSIHGSAVGYESDQWRGGVVDESEFYGKGVFARFADESFRLYGKGGAVRDWGEDLWGFAVGAGAELRFSKNAGVAADYSVRAWFKERDKDAQLRVLVNLSF